MLDPTNKDNKDLPLTIRAVFIIGPDKKLKLSLNCESFRELSDINLSVHDANLSCSMVLKLQRNVTFFSRGQS